MRLREIDHILMLVNNWLGVIKLVKVSIVACSMHRSLAHEEDALAQQSCSVQREYQRPEAVHKTRKRRSRVEWRQGRSERLQHHCIAKGAGAIRVIWPLAGAESETRGRVHWGVGG